MKLILIIYLFLFSIILSQIFTTNAYALDQCPGVFGLNDCEYDASKGEKCLNPSTPQAECVDSAGNPLVGTGTNPGAPAGGAAGPGPGPGAVAPGAGGPTAVEKVIGTVKAPQQISSIGYGAGGISTLLSNIVKIIYSIAAVITVFMVIFSAFQWIISGGDKEKIAAARGRLTWAIIGIVVLALTFVFLSTFGFITGFTFFTP